MSYKHTQTAWLPSAAISNQYSGEGLTHQSMLHTVRLLSFAFLHILVSVSLDGYHDKPIRKYILLKTLLSQGVIFMQR